MRFLIKFIARILLNSVALWAAERFIVGFTIAPQSFTYLAWLNVSPEISSLIAGGFVLALLNAFIKPLLRLVSLPFLIITLGLFNIVINLIILWLADWWLAPLVINGFTAYFFGSLLIGIANTIL